MLSWPYALPYEIERESYKVSALGLPPLASQMQSGKTRMRPQFTLRITTVQCSMIFEPEQLAVFHQFVRDTGDGAMEFRMPVWIPSRAVYEERTVQIKNGVAGITEEVFALDDTRVGLTLDVRNLY